MKLNLDLADFRYSHFEVDVLSKLETFKGRWTSFGNLSPERLKQLKTQALIENIGSSTRIEGGPLSNSQIKELELPKSNENLCFSSKDEEDAAGYAVALLLILNEWKDMPLSEVLVRMLHGSLMGKGNRKLGPVDDYKTVDNAVVALREGKIAGTVFQPAPAAETPWLMEQLVEWYDDEIGRGVYHPLLLIAVFVVSFLAIHPFQDGNGRLSRLLTTLLLLRSGFDYVPYSSLESVIEKSKASYYLALRKTQLSLEKESPDWRPFFDYFLNSLWIQMKVLESKVFQKHLLSGVPELSRSILKLLSSGDSMGISDLEKALKTPRSTIRFHLRRLIDEGRIISSGKARAVRYQITDAPSWNFE